mgnify:CR=1 FL=1
MKMVPIGYRVVIKIGKTNIEKASEKGVIYIPEDVKDKERSVQQEAVIMEIGPTAFKGSDFEGSDIKVGDRVLVTRYSGESREEDGSYRVINDEDVLCKLIED